MKTASLLFVAALLFTLRAAAFPVPPPGASLAGLLEEPPGVTLVSAEGFSPSDPEDALYAVEDAAVAWLNWGTAALVLEVQGPRTLRLHHFIGNSNTGGYTMVRLDGRSVREFHYSSGPSTDVVVPAGVHFVDFIAYATPVGLYKVSELLPGLPEMPEPDVFLPAQGPVRMRLRAVSATPVTWSAAGLPGDLALDASGLLTGSETGFGNAGFADRAWVTMTNAAGSHVEQLAFYTVDVPEEVSPDVPLAGRSDRAWPHYYYYGAFGVSWHGGQSLPGMPEIVRQDGAGGNAELVALVTGPETVWFRASEYAGPTDPVVVKVDGVEVLRRHVGSMLREEMSVSIPPGEHEVAWTLPRDGGRLGMVRLGSSAAPRFTGALTVPLTAGAAFAHTFTAVAPGPVTWSGADLPGGVTLHAGTGVITGTLNSGEHMITVTASHGGQSTAVRVRLSVQQSVAAVLGDMGAPWLQPVPRSYYYEQTTPWMRQPGGAPDGGESLAIWATGYRGEQSRLETVVTGPDTLVCRFHGGSGMTLEAQIDGVSYRTQRDVQGWGNSLTVPIPPGRHVLVLRAMLLHYGSGSLALDRLLLASGGTPALTPPPAMYVDDEAFRITIPVAGGPADLSAMHLPPGLAVDGGDIAGNAVFAPGTNYFSTITATRGGMPASAHVEWWHTELTSALGSPGWYGFTNEVWFAAIEVTDAGWDGVDGVVMKVPRTGPRTATLARRITGPDTLTLRRRSHGSVQFCITVDGAPAHETLLNDEPWGQVSVPIPAGPHMVQLIARTAEPDGARYPEYDSEIYYPQIVLDDVRLADSASVTITSPERELRARVGESFHFQPSHTGTVLSWEAQNVPDGFAFNAQTGALSAPAITTPGIQPVRLTALGASGAHTIQITIHVAGPIAQGDSPQLYLAQNHWALTPLEGQLPVTSVDGADVHYCDYADGGDMYATVQGPDTLHFWWRPLYGSSTYISARADQLIAVGSPSYADDRWRRLSLPIPAGSHRVVIATNSYAAVDHITLASDGLPLPLVEEVMTSPAGNFSLPLSALPAADTWTATPFSITAAGVLGGTLTGATDVRVSATNAQGTGHAVFLLRSPEALADALDAALPVIAESPFWTAVTPPPEVRPRPADGEDYVQHQQDTYLQVDVPAGGGLLSLWAYARDEDGTTLNTTYQWGGGNGLSMDFPVPGGAWRRILLPLPEEGGSVTLGTWSGFSPEPSLWLDRLEILLPGDPIIDVRALPEARAGEPYTAALRLITGAPVTWQAQNLPPGLTLDAATGLISGTPAAGFAGGDHPLRVTATSAAGRTTFALLLLPLESEPVEGGRWTRQTDSRWLTVEDAARGSVLSLEPLPGAVNHIEPIHLCVQAPCFVTFHARLTGGSSADPLLTVLADQLNPDAFITRGPSASWERGVIAVPGYGPARVSFYGQRTAGGGGLALDDVRVFPWDADANADGLPNSLEAALSRWPDAPSAGDPHFSAVPDASGVLVSFGESPAENVFTPVREYAMILRLEQSADLTPWQPAAVMEEIPGTHLRRWRIPAPVAPRAFHRVQALPHPQ